MKSNTWLLDHAHDITSQNGEDGVIAKTLETIGEGDRWCVEFGAWDGKLFSNTYNLINNLGYSGVLIEGDSRKWREVRDLYASRSDVITLNQFVGFSETDNLDTILADTSIPQNFDLLSIDIDGNDFHVWDAMRSYQPKVVCVEFNPTIGNEVSFVQPRDMSVSQGSSLKAFTEMARQKGYELIAVTDCNGIFVDAKYFDRFEIQDNSLGALRSNNNYAMEMFVGFDGTVFLRGNRHLTWHGIEINEASLQTLPKVLRQMPDRYNKLQRFLFKWYKRMHHRKAA